MWRRGKNVVIDLFPVREAVWPLAVERVGAPWALGVRTAQPVDPGDSRPLGEAVEAAAVV